MDQNRIYNHSISPSDIITSQRENHGVKKEIPRDSKQITDLSSPLSFEKSKCNNGAVDQDTLCSPPKDKESNFDPESQSNTKSLVEHSRSEIKREIPIIHPKSEEIMKKRYYKANRSRTYNPMSDRKSTNVRDNNRRCHSVPKNVSSNLLYNLLFANNNDQQNSSIHQMNIPEPHQELFNEFSDQNSMKSVETYVLNVQTQTTKHSQSTALINDNDLSLSVLDNSVNSSVISSSVPLSQHQPIQIDQDLHNSNEKQNIGIVSRKKKIGIVSQKQKQEQKQIKSPSNTEKTYRKIHLYSVSDRTNALPVNIENRGKMYLNIKPRFTKLKELCNKGQIKGKTCKKCGEMKYSDSSSRPPFHICSKFVYEISTLSRKLYNMEQLCRLKLVND